MFESKLNRRKVKFIDDELYHQDDAEMMVEALAKEQETIDVSPARTAAFSDELRMPRDVPSAIASLCSAPLLTMSFPCPTR